MALQVQGYVEVAFFQIPAKIMDRGDSPGTIKDNDLVNQRVVVRQGLPIGFHQPCDRRICPVSLDFSWKAEATDKVPQ
jgi:hypothetical protein